MNKEMVSLFNDQINRELYSAYLYLAIAHRFEKANLKGFAHWYKVQAREEEEHAEWFMDYLEQEGETVHLQAIQEPELSSSSFQDLPEEALRHEKYITKQIERLCEAAEKCMDRRTRQMLNRLIDEQGEEEKNAREIADHMAMKYESIAALDRMDRDLGKRGKK